jgi:hypothetical protein
MKRRLIALCQLLFACMVFLSVPPESAQACSCAMAPSVQQELQRKTAVFSGRVVKLTEPGKGLIRSSADPVTATFAVANVWKGEAKPQLAVYTAISSASCGFSFQMNTDYLVYASSDGNGKLTTIICDRTKPIADASEDLTALGAGDKPAPLAYPEQETGKLLDSFYLAVTFAVSFLICFTAIRLLFGIYLTRKYIAKRLEAYTTVEQGEQPSTIRFGVKRSVHNTKAKLAVGFISLGAAFVITLIVYVLL